MLFAIHILMAVDPLTDKTQLAYRRECLEAIMIVGHDDQFTTYGLPSTPLGNAVALECSFQPRASQGDPGVASSHARATPRTAESGTP